LKHRKSLIEKPTTKTMLSAKNDLQMVAGEHHNRITSNTVKNEPNGS
jgi:hypothetical protein